MVSAPILSMNKKLIQTEGVESIIYEFFHLNKLQSSEVQTNCNALHWTLYFEKKEDTAHRKKKPIYTMAE